MARRFRVIQYDGPEGWIIKVFRQSINRLSFLDGRTIQTWEIAEGEVIHHRHPNNIFGNNPNYSGIDNVEEDGCIYYKNQDGVCHLCGIAFISGNRKPTACKSVSFPKPPLDGKVPQ